MSEPRLGVSKGGQPMHYSVGALVRRGDEFLVIDRARFPLADACVAGHIDEGELEIEALHREVREEVGLGVTQAHLVFSGELKNPCRRGVNVHFWYVYECETVGEVCFNPSEVKAARWLSLTELRNLPTLEPVWVAILAQVYP